MKARIAMAEAAVWMLKDLVGEDLYESMKRSLDC